MDSDTIIPFVVMVLFVLALPFLIIYSERQRKINMRLRGFCPKCGYFLYANVSGVCPECGTKI